MKESSLNPLLATSVITVTEAAPDGNWPQVAIDVSHTGEDVNDAPRRLVNALDTLLEKKGINWIIETAQQLKS